MQTPKEAAPERFLPSAATAAVLPPATGYGAPLSYGYDRPPIGSGGESGEGNQLGEYGRILYRRRKSILLLALTGALGGVLLNLGTLPVYRARTSLDIQSLNSDFLDMHAVATTGGEGGGSGGEAYVQTQIKLLQSDTLLDHTVRNLEALPHPASVERDDLLSRAERALHLGGKAPLSYNALLEDAARHVTVKPLGLTRLVEISCDSWNAKFSAQFCNTLTGTFREDDYATRGADATKTSEWLTRQVADVRVQVEQSEKKLEDATGGNGLVLSQQNTSVSEDRLRQVQQELVRAEADRMEKQAQYETSRSAPAESLPTVIDDPNLRLAQGKLADLRGKVAELVPPLTEENPRVIHLRSQIREAETEMSTQRGAVVARLRDDFDAAKHREDLLSATYATQEQRTSGELDKTNKVNLLRREVDSEQQLYQTLLQRAKEAGFASAMQVSTIRTVDAAKAPKVPFAPRRTGAVGVGFLLGSLLGVGFAFYKERTSGVIHFPGEIPRLLHVQELGVIPNMGSRRAQLYGAARTARATRRKLALNGPSGNSMFPSLREPLPPSPADAIAISVWRDRASVVAEAYRSTTFSILLASRTAGTGRRYVISSPNSGEGKTTVVSNLGVTLSQSQRRVVIVDGDLRKPGLHKALGLENTVGLRNVLRGELDPESCELSAFCRATAIPNLSVVTSGTGSEEVTGLLHSPHAAELLARLSKEFDLVLIDTPPMLHMADARIFADHADGVILVLRAGITNFEQASSARDLFVHDRVRVLGTILNGFNPGHEGRGSYYDSYYRYQQAAESLDETGNGAGQETRPEAHSKTQDENKVGV